MNTKRKYLLVTWLLLGALFGAPCLTIRGQSTSIDAGLLKELDEAMQILETSDDTASVWGTLRRIETDCTASADWRIRYKFHKICGLLDSYYAGNWDAAIEDYKKAYELFPSSEPADCDFLETADGLCWSYMELDRYDEAERVASKALVRGLAVADSCDDSSVLFTDLALCYERRGDTIMPKFFHEKSQKLGIYRYQLQNNPQSIDQLKRQMEIIFEGMNNQRAYFTRNHPNYFQLMCQYFHMVFTSNNVWEMVWLGEQLLTTVRDSSLMEIEGLDPIFHGLLFGYSAKGELEKAEALLPEALSYFNQFPDLQIDEGMLLFQIGCGLMEDWKYEDALKYFRKGERKMSKKNRQELKQELEDRKKFCESKTKKKRGK